MLRTCLLAAALALTGGCAAATGPTGGLDVPACESVVYWGKAVPADVTATGCTDTAGTWHAVRGIACTDGTALVTFTQHSSGYWGRTPGGWWSGTGPDPIASDASYRTAAAACRP